MGFGKAAIVGVGTIGRGWALLYAKAGYSVSLFDPDIAAMNASLGAIATSLDDMAAFGLVRGRDKIMARITIAPCLRDAVADAGIIQESAPESLDAKREAIAEIGRDASSTAIIASSCSSLLPADIFEGAAGPERCIVAHPFNPPHLVPLVELLAGPATSEETIERTRDIMLQLDQAPIILRKPVPGYVANRLQAAVINESMHLVASGVISPDDLDLCMTESLGRRWSFLGPFATMDLNADDGVEGYARRFREAYEELGRDLGVAAPWDDAAIAAVTEACRARTPMQDLRSKREWRDRQLMWSLVRSRTGPRDGMEAAKETA
jgi:3-hydroxyacyl-CoA dehydrogenase